MNMAEQMMQKACEEEARIAAAVAEEREACAKLVEDALGKTEIAQWIRARGQ